MTTTRVAAGSLAALAPGTVRVVPLPRGSFGLPPVIPVEALVLRDLLGAPRAYLNQCQHLPVPLDGASREFLSADGRALECLTHGALYRLDDGVCFEGPCRGRALRAIELAVEGDALYLIA